jgi:hypothetical protein
MYVRTYVCGQMQRFWLTSYVVEQLLWRAPWSEGQKATGPNTCPPQSHACAAGATRTELTKRSCSSLRDRAEHINEMVRKRRATQKKSSSSSTTYFLLLVLQHQVRCVNRTGKSDPMGHGAQRFSEPGWPGDASPNGKRRGTPLLLER